MWGKLRRKISRTKPAAGQDSTKEVVLKSFVEVVSLRSENPSDCCNTDRGKSSDENGFLNQDGQTGCRCSPLLHFQKHFFGSFRSKKVTEDCGGRSADCQNGLEMRRPEFEDIDELSPAEDPNRLPVDRRSYDAMDCDLNQTCDQPVDEDGNSCELESREAYSLEWASTDAVGIRQNGEREILEDTPIPLLEDMKLPPPKLKRRERTKVLETGESQRTVAKLEQTHCSSVCSDRPAADSVALQRDSKVFSSLCESRSGFNMMNTNAEGVCSSSHLKGVESALDCSCEMVLMYKCDDKEESMDSGHHPSDGDVEKGHSSPDLDLDEFDGRESGYTTLDDFLPLEAQQVSSVYAASLGVDVEGCYDPSDRISGQLDMLALQSQCETFEESGISTLVDEPTAHVFRTSAWLQPTDNLVFSGEDVISRDQSNSNISASFPVEFGSIDRRNVRQWEHVDYVPADVSVSKIYEDSSNSGINDVYASVPRYCAAKLEESSSCETAVFEDKQMAKKSSVERSSPSNWPAKDDDFDAGSFANLEAGIPASSLSVLDGPIDEWKGTYPDLSSAAALDSDDGENVPPVPSRNYETCIGTMNVELDSQNLEGSDERIHMSWEEVLREARSLGIPLNRPRPYQIPFSDRPALRSESLMSPHVSESGQVECSLDKSAVCCLNPTTKKLETKKGSPFKEKFRLPNPFSRKNKPEHNESFGEGDGGHKNKHLHGTPTKGKKSSIFRHHSSVDVQKRCLPRPPPADAEEAFGIDQLNCGRVYRASSQSGNQRMAISLHLQFSNETPANRSWGSSSNILRVSSTGCRSRRVFSDSSQWPNSSESLLPFSDSGDGTGA